MEEYQLHYRESQARLRFFRSLAEGDSKGAPDIPTSSLAEIEAEIEHFTIDEFESMLKLARMLGTYVFESLVQAIFIHDPEDGWSDYFTPVPGLPDLFIWDDTSLLWFFAEVKGPNDSIQLSQYNWIVQNWDNVLGHVVLLSLWPDEQL